MSDFTLRFHGREVDETVRRAAVRGLAEGAEHLLDESRKVVPLEEGVLSASGHTSVDEQRLEAAVAYDTPYAVVQHEDLTLAHNAGRTGKYLEAPARQVGQAIRDHVAGRLREALR
jgi:hypothetical protein